MTFGALCSLGATDIVAGRNSRTQRKGKETSVYRSIELMWYEGERRYLSEGSGISRAKLQGGRDECKIEGMEGGRKKKNRSDRARSFVLCRGH